MSLPELLNSSSIQIALCGLACLRLILDPIIRWERLMQGKDFHVIGKWLAIGYLVLWLPSLIR